MVTAAMLGGGNPASEPLFRLSYQSALQAEWAVRASSKQA